MKPNQRATVYTLLERNTPGREIARITGIDRKTVRSYRTRWLAEISNSPYKDFPTLSNAEFHRIGSRKRSNAES